MTVSLKHTFQSAKTDSADTTLIQPSNWNQEHELTLATNKVLGRATAGTGAAEELSIGTALSLSGGTLAVTTVPVTNGGTGSTTLTANNVLLGNGTSAVQTVAPGTSGNVLTSNGTAWTSAAAPSFVVNYPQNIQSANYTLVLGDAGKQIFHPVSDTTVRTYTIPANSSVAFPIGTVVLFTVENGGVAVKVSITSDTLVFGAGTTGSIIVPVNNTLMAVKVTATKWMANYLYQTGAASASQAVAVVGSITPVIAYPWNVSTGFGTAYTAPATLPTGVGLGVAFSPTGDAIAVAHATTPFISAYPFSSAGYGTKYANPATLPAGQGNGVAFSPNNDAIAVAHSLTPCVSAYPWNSGTGFGTKYANPATLPAGQGNEVSFSPGANAIAIAHNTTPFVSVYPWNVSTGFGTKYTNPATLPVSAGNSVAFSPAGDAIAVAGSGTPFIQAYPWNSGTGFGTKYTNPTVLPGGSCSGVAFHPAGNAIAVSNNTAPFYAVYAWSAGGFGARYALTSSGPPDVQTGVAFSSGGDAIAFCGTTTTPLVSAYPWNSTTGFGTAYTSPALIYDVQDIEFTSF